MNIGGAAMRISARDRSKGTIVGVTEGQTAARAAVEVSGVMAVG